MSEQAKKKGSSSGAEQSSQAAISREGDESELLSKYCQSLRYHRRGGIWRRPNCRRQRSSLSETSAAEMFPEAADQVRAIKHIPLVVHLPNQSPNWMVIPPNKIIELWRVESKASTQKFHLRVQYCR